MVCRAGLSIYEGQSGSSRGVEPPSAAAKGASICGYSTTSLVLQIFTVRIASRAAPHCQRSSQCHHAPIPLGSLLKTAFVVTAILVAVAHRCVLDLQTLFESFFAAKKKVVLKE